MSEYRNSEAMRVLSEKPDGGILGSPEAFAKLINGRATTMDASLLRIEMAHPTKPRRRPRPVSPITPKRV